MNLCCSICTELLCPTGDVYVTPCGHLFHQHCLLQWFERSKTCPQCRNKCLQKSIHKVYFNLANLNTSSIDIGSLQQQLEDAKLQYQVKFKEEDKLKDEINNLKTTRKRCMETIKVLESRDKSNKFIITQFSEQIKALKKDTSVVEVQRSEIMELKQQIALMETIQTMLSGTSSEVENLLKDETKSENLATWVVILKKELKVCESKKSDMRNMLKKVQNEIRKLQDIKRNLESKVVGLESENSQLNAKVEELKQSNEKLNSKSMTNNVCNNNNANSNLNSNGLPSSICNICMKSTLFKKNLSVIDQNNFSPGIPQKIKEIEDSDSPYLNIKSSSLGLNPILKVAEQIRGNKKDIHRKPNFKKPETIFETNSNFGILKQTRSEGLSDKYSIFKRPRLTDQLINNRPNEMIYNGFGGSEKKRISPKKYSLDDEIQNKLSNINNRLKSGKLKKTTSSTHLSTENSIDKFINQINNKL